MSFDQINWKDLADRSVNMFIRTLRKEEDYDLAQEYFDEEVTDKLDEHEIELNYSLYVDIPEDYLKEFLKRAADQIKGLKADLGLEEDAYPDEICALHTYMCGQLSEREDGDQITDWWAKIDLSQV